VIIGAYIASSTDAAFFTTIVISAHGLGLCVV
jgi:hypothetical protein